MTAVSKDGKTLDVALTARTKAGAFFEKKRLGESLAAILPVCPKNGVISESVGAIIQLRASANGVFAEKAIISV